MIRKGAILVVLAATVATTSTPAFASPANDDVSNASPIVALPFTDSTDTDGATVESGEPTEGCAPIGATVWYTFTSAEDQRLVVDTIGSDFDTVVVVFESDVGSPVACSDDAVERQSRILMDVTGGTTYLIQAGGWNGNTGALTLNAAVGSPAPANDAPAGATLIAALPFTDAANTGDTSTGAEQPSCGNIGSTLWYSYTPSTVGSITADTLGSNYDTVLVAYLEVAGRLIEWSCSDDAKDTLQSALTVPAVPGVRILFQAGGYFGYVGDLVLNVA